MLGHSSDYLEGKLNAILLLRAENRKEKLLSELGKLLRQLPNLIHHWAPIDTSDIESNTEGN